MIVRPAYYSYAPGNKLGGDITAEDLEYTFQKHAENGLELQCQIEVHGKSFWVFKEIEE